MHPLVLGTVILSQAARNLFVVAAEARAARVEAAVAEGAARCVRGALAQSVWARLAPGSKGPRAGSACQHKLGGLAPGGCKKEILNFGAA